MTPQFGEGSAGGGLETVRVSTVLGERSGPVGVAWTTAIASPSPGHSPFVVVARPNLPVVPFTLFVPAVAVVDQRHAELTTGAGQAGVAAAVLDLKMDDVEGELCLIASVWIEPQADDEEAVFENARDAAIFALKLGAAAGPWHGNLAAVDVPENPNFRQPN
jgi:5,6,7,8-tetrahydromethanopterin hydro-lyase